MTDQHQKHLDQLQADAELMRRTQALRDDDWPVLTEEQRRAQRKMVEDHKRNNSRLNWILVGGCVGFGLFRLIGGHVADGLATLGLAAFVAYVSRGEDL